MQDIKHNDNVAFMFSYIDEDWFTIFAHNIVEATLKAREYACIDCGHTIRLVDIKWNYADNMGWIGE